MIDEASATLQYNRDLLQHALDFARQGITVFDRDLRLICWNREFRDIFEIPPDRIRTGMGLEEVVRFNAERGIYGERPIDSHVATRIELLGNEADPVRLRLYHSGDTIEVRSARMPDGGIVTTYTDVTQAVAAEEALERTNETLEQRVRQRTEELVRLNRELERAKLLADEANLSKTRFLAAASHDILQPLNAARLYATSLLERTRDVEVAGANGASALASNLDLSLEAVEEILTALLDISRLDAGAMKAERSVFPIEELLAQLRVEFAPLAAEKGLKLTFMPCALSVLSDRRLLRRLLQNLISNAIKYTPKGRVIVGCRRRGSELRIEVWDTGIGIPESKQGDIFREFERLDAAARTARGLGLGLSIVERISRVLDHPISLASRPGIGSVFRVPVPVAVGAPVLHRAEPSSQAPSPHLPLHGMKVLAIDNEPRILDGLQILLSGWGCTVMTAADAKEAMQALAHGEAPDVLLADYHLDEGDGLACVAAVRVRLGKYVPAVLITADRSPEVRDLCTEQNVRLLNKPVRPAALRALLSQWRVLQQAAE